MMYKWYHLSLMMVASFLKDMGNQSTKTYIVPCLDKLLDKIIVSQLGYLCRPEYCFGIGKVKFIPLRGNHINFPPLKHASVRKPPLNSSIFLQDTNLDTVKQRQNGVYIKNGWVTI